MLHGTAGQKCAFGARVEMACLHGELWFEWECTWSACKVTNRAQAGLLPLPTRPVATQPAARCRHTHLGSGLHVGAPGEKLLHHIQVPATCCQMQRAVSFLHVKHEHSGVDEPTRPSGTEPLPSGTGSLDHNLPHVACTCFTPPRRWPPGWTHAEVAPARPPGARDMLPDARVYVDRPAWAAKSTGGQAFTFNMARSNMAHEYGA